MYKNLFKRIYVGILKIWGKTSDKKELWDKEFRTGIWDYLGDTKEDLIYDYIGKYLASGSLLDLGCGPGNTCFDMEPDDFESYTGVDISQVAVEQAIGQAGKVNLTGKTEFVESDISEYTPSKKYNIILFRESLYYISTKMIPGLLQKYAPYLQENGVFITRIWNKNRYPGLLASIRKNFNVKEEFSSPDDNSSIMVFN